MFHLAGLPSYLVLAELSVKQVLRGELPTPSYPAALRKHAAEVWWGRADITFGYARSYYAAHAVLAARGEWITNEKTLLTRAGLRQIDEFIAAVQPDPDGRDLVDRSHTVCLAALDKAH
jgi:hypothetical protein